MTRGLELWHKFVDVFLCELGKLPEDQLSKFWEAQTARTRGYLGFKGEASGLLHRMAEPLGMKPLHKEYMSIDGEFTDGKGFPQIFVEVENSAESLARRA